MAAETKDLWQNPADGKLYIRTFTENEGARQEVTSASDAQVIIEQKFGNEEDIGLSAADIKRVAGSCVAKMEIDGLLT